MNTVLGNRHIKQKHANEYYANKGNASVLLNKIGHDIMGLMQLNEDKEN